MIKSGNTFHWQTCIVLLPWALFRKIQYVLPALLPSISFYNCSRFKREKNDAAIKTDLIDSVKVEIK